MLELLKNTIKDFYQKYELVMGLTMFEPWEQKLINSAVAFIICLVVFSSYVYLPAYLKTFLYFISPISHAEKTTPSYAPIMQTQKMSLG